MTLDELLASPRSVLLVGFGVANRAVAASLVARGHQVVAIDDGPNDDARAAAAALGIALSSPDDVEPYVNGADLVIPTPGLPERHAVFGSADASGIPVVSELDLAAVWDDRPILAVTGTNGKTTTVELAVAALQQGGLGAVAAGNTDIPLVAAIDDPDIDVFVVEASSFRLARASRFRPTVAVWLNFAPDHLDVHRDLERYEAAKAKLFELGAAGTLVANADDAVVMGNVPSDARVVTFAAAADADWHVEGAALHGPGGPFVAVDGLWRSLPHDIANTLAVAAAVAALGIEPAAVARAAADFSALAHRVSPVGELDGQVWFDDSKATTPHATLAALRGFDEVVLVAGGRNKGVDLGELAAGIDHVRAVVAIGDAACEVAAAFSGRVPVARADSMESAVDAARDFSTGEVPVLLSPGCASFDWYTSYGERGDDFARIVREREAAS